jgi:hypothetical protein
MPHLNNWQRLWAVLSVVLLIIMTFTMLSSDWLTKDPKIAADLASPACRGWAELPSGFFPESYPKADDACYALQVFLFEKQTNIKTSDEYASFLAKARIKTLGFWFTIWAVTILWLYVIGWATGWVSRNFNKPPSP